MRAVPEIGEFELTLHGHRVRYLQAGDGPVLAFIHGITSSADTWLPRRNREPTRAWTLRLNGNDTVLAA